MDGFHAKELLAILVTQFLFSRQSFQYFLLPYIQGVGRIL